MVSIDNVSMYFGGFELLSNVSFLVNPRDRIGLTGKNGAGKTTLLKIIHGSQSPTSGNISIPSNARIGYLPQSMKVADKTTILDETHKAFSKQIKLESDIIKVTTDIASRDDFESAEYLSACDSLIDLQDAYKVGGGITYVAETEQTLIGLGFERKDFARPTSELSGGWRMRIELAKILLEKPGLLLLDEPTNHLDIDSIQWLETLLDNYPGAVILVSHDRAFLDNITKRTIEISLANVYDYKVAYSKYVILRNERREQQMAAYRNQRKMIEDTERFIKRFRYKATKAVQVQARIKQLKKLKRLEVDEEDSSSIKIKFAPAPRSGTIVAEAENLSKSFDALTVLKNVDFIIERGEKVAFVGRNGEGKTTFSRILIGELDYIGSLKMGHNLKTGYYAQNQDELLNESLTVFDTIDRVATGDIRTKIRDILGAFLFGGEDIDKKVKVLSGGERSRLALIKLLLEPYNLLVLDEPTNHLDMISKDLLKQALLKYDGTLIVVSHDRDFLDGLIDKVYEFRENRIKECIGGIYDFLKNKSLKNLNELEKKDKRTNKRQSEPVSINKQQYLLKKDFEKRLRKMKKELSTIESLIEKAEVEKKEMDQCLSDPGDSDIKVDKKFYTDYEKLGMEINQQVDKWEKLSHEIEEYQKQNIL